jgi:hypothetical protein
VCYVSVVQLPVSTGAMALRSAGMGRGNASWQSDAVRGDQTTWVTELWHAWLAEKPLSSLQQHIINTLAPVFNVFHGVLKQLGADTSVQERFRLLPPNHPQALSIQVAKYVRTQSSGVARTCVLKTLEYACIMHAGRRGS